MIKHGEENTNLLVLLEAEKPSAESGDCCGGAVLHWYWQHMVYFIYLCSDPMLYVSCILLSLFF